MRVRKVAVDRRGDGSVTRQREARCRDHKRLAAEVRPAIVALFRAAEQLGRTRPTVAAIRSHLISIGLDMGHDRIMRMLVSLESKGELPELPLSRAQQGGITSGLARNRSDISDADRAAHRERAEAIRLEALEARRGLDVPPVKPSGRRPRHRLSDAEKDAMEFMGWQTHMGIRRQERSW